METVYFIILLLVLAFGVRNALARPSAVYEWPAFMSLTFLIFIVPQCISLMRFPGAAFGSPVENALLMTLLCAVVCVLGYPRRVMPRIHAFAVTPLDDAKLKLGGIVFLIIATICGNLISRMGADETGGSMWSGKVTIYHFFSQLIFPSFAILLRHSIRYRSKGTTLMALFAALPAIQASLFAGRRESTVHFLLTIGIVLWCERRISPPRGVVAALAVFAMLAIPATGKYRGAAGTGDWQEVKKIDLVGNFDNYLNSESILELRNAAMVITGTLKTGNYGFGVAYWDEVIWRFVPAQIVGRELKNLLMIEKDEGVEDKLAGTGYSIPVGSTLTGMGDSFTQFGFAGSLFFLIPAMLFKTLWQAAQDSCGVFAQLMYIGIITAGMRSLTHQTVDFLPSLIYQSVFIGSLWYYARKKTSQRHRTPVARH